MTGRKIWEIHSLSVGGAIRTTADGLADIDGLVLSEKAYFLAVSAFRPVQLVGMVDRLGAAEAAQALVSHFRSASRVDATCGRALVIAAVHSNGVTLVRNDEAAATAALPVSYRR